MNISRDIYLEKLIRKKQNGMIKVITGIRRCGKSYLLFRLFRQYLADEGIPADHIIEIAFDDRRNRKLRDPDACLTYIDARCADAHPYYILLDEVQYMSEFEDVLLSLMHLPNADIYVTGSNSKFLSSDIITEFRGRGDEIRVYPLSFSETFSAGVFEGFEDAWNHYFTYGGMPYIMSLDSEEDKAFYLQNLFKETYLKDILERNHIRGDIQLEELVNIVSSSVGSLTNANKLANTFRSVEKVSLSAPTIKEYLGFLEEAFILEKALRYDVKGKRYMNTPYKYYFTDVGLRNARLNFRQQEENHIMENILFNELKVRGYNVDVGMVELRRRRSDGTYQKMQTEIDFVANKGSRRYYIQSAFSLPDKEKEIQEKRPLRSLSDSFKKIIIIKDNILLRRDEEGIVTMGLKQFLLDPESMDL